jgi:NADH dehydrogenase
MKSVSEALYLRNKILQNFEDAVSCQNEEEKQRLLTICVVGGGPTGVEIAGSLAEMKKYVIPKDFKELNNNTINIYLLEASSKILGNMSVISSEKTKQFLKKTGVKIITDATVNNYDGKTVFINNNVEIQSSTLIWTAGITGNTLPGLSSTAYGKGNRLRVDSFNRINTYETIFAIGDIALMQTPEFPNGHPQVAQVAIQQARLLAKNLENLIANKSLIPFVYHDFGSMATIGRNLAVVEIGKFRSQGLLAWFIWMFVHLMAIVGVKNRLLIFINWFWNYITYDQSLRLIIKTKNKE